MENSLHIQWYPGHMAKTRRMIIDQLRNMDAVCEILDARIPASSRNPDVEELTRGKPRLIVLNRIDLADPAASQQWKAYFEKKGCAVLESNAKAGQGANHFAPAVRELLAEKIAAFAEKGQAGRVLRVMVLGIPNVGKSTFINQVSGRKTAKAEDRPGVTRSKQWIPVNKNMELLDTPGMLWPKFEDPHVGMWLACTGAVRDEIVDREELAAHLAAYLCRHYPKAVLDRYKVQAEPEDTCLLEKMGRKRGFLVRGGGVDTERMACILLDEFRSGKLGRFTLELPEEEQNE